MKISYSVKDDKIVSANNQANSGYLNWLANNIDFDIIEVETEDSLFCNTSNLKVENGSIIIDVEKIEQEAKEELRKQYKTERDLALNDSEIIIEDMIFQTRPSDFINLTVGIDENSTEWILKDDSIATVTTEHLKSVLKQGKTQAKLIFDIYINKVKDL